ncbi:MAG: hypothetical protein J1E80_08065, partial [Desulfovibrionaceae bacterium]|nr:hypothetical protein [Desulfovibrionaceae bacterium]
MLPVKPTPIPMPFAQNGNKNDIPEQSPGASEPNASWSAGFPPITMYPREAGGLPPMGQDFNGILNALSQQAFWRQSGGMAEWSADLDYPVPALVVGSDGKYYTSLQASGPSGAGAKDPTDAENSAWWAQAMLNGSDDVFTPPTNSEPGKQGLVPAPDMSAEAAARCVLGADAHWHEFDDTVAMNEGKYGVPALEGGIKFCTFRNFGLTNGSSSNYKSPTFSGSNIEIMGGNPVHVS